MVPAVVVAEAMAISEEITFSLRLALSELQNEEITEHQRGNSTSALLTRARRLTAQLHHTLLAAP